MLNDGTGPDKLTNRFKRYPAIALYRKVYGADGHISRPDLPVTEACTKTVKWWRHREFKRFVSLKNAGKRINSHHVAGAVNPDFLPVRNMCEKPVYGMAHINHYYTKSREDFAGRLRVGTPCYNNRDCDGFFMTNPDMWPVAMELIKSIKDEHFPTADCLSRKYGIYTTGSGNRVILGRMNRQIITNESRI